jgi:hypothetical protein
MVDLVYGRLSDRNYREAAAKLPAIAVPLAGPGNIAGPSAARRATFEKGGRWRARPRRPRKSEGPADLSVCGATMLELG